MNTIPFPISLVSSTSSWTWTFQAEERLPSVPPTWPAVRERLIEAEYQRGTLEGNARWHRALRDATDDLRTSLGSPGAAGTVVERIHEVSGQFLDTSVKHLWLLLALRAITSTPALRETLHVWLGRARPSSHDTRYRLVNWAHALPRVGLRLATDDRFWRAAGHDPYTRWGRVLDDAVQQKARLWASWEPSEQAEVQRSSFETVDGACVRRSRSVWWNAWNVRACWRGIATSPGWAPGWIRRWNGAPWRGCARC